MARNNSAISRFRVKGERFATKTLTSADPVFLAMLKRAVRSTAALNAQKKKTGR